jgi:hypothetical protein
LTSHNLKLLDALAGGHLADIEVSLELIAVTMTHALKMPTAA